MERDLQVGRQKIRFDREATIALYRDEIKESAADHCTCISCKNFAAQRSSVYPAEFLELLGSLGIDPLKEWEAFDYDFGPNQSPIRLYGGWFLFSGELIEGTDSRPAQTPDTFSFFFTTSFPASTFQQAIKICAVEFTVQVPWILPL
jgi:hypothetical protein